jgi:hypothetical protein
LFERSWSKLSIPTVDYKLFSFWGDALGGGTSFIMDVIRGETAEVDTGLIMESGRFSTANPAFSKGTEFDE